MHIKISCHSLLGIREQLSIISFLIMYMHFFDPTVGPEEIIVPV